MGPSSRQRRCRLWEKHASIGGITDVLNDAFKAGIGRAAGAGRAGGRGGGAAGRKG